jgi:tRNA pseudouridine32 synthase/23S rRNA pseudouridine746 synthase
MRRFRFTVSEVSQAPARLGEVLMAATRLPATQLQDAASKGALWWQRGGKGRILRQRSLEVQVRPQDKVELYFDPKILKLPAFTAPVLIEETAHYGVWQKPAGILPQGSQTGDHASLLRAVELVRGHEVFLVHRLDRETEGLMLIAYDSGAAAKLSALFQDRKVNKSYEAIVLGELAAGSRQSIRDKLDGKEAVTHFEVIESRKGQSHLRIEIETGRLHQIRRHLEIIGHPVMGDPKYGTGNKNRSGLQLVATSLEIFDPWERADKRWELEGKLSIAP